MTLIITAAAAVIATVARFLSPRAGELHLGALSLMYWGAALMWCVDGFASVAGGGTFVELADAAVMVDDVLLGVCVVALGLVAWACIIAVGRVRARRGGAA